MKKFDKTRIDVVSDETLWKGWSHLRKLTFDYTSDQGRTDRLAWEVYDRGEAIAVLLFNADRQTVVFVRQFRVAVYAAGDPAFLLEVPAGSLEKGEDPADAIGRETLEETGYKVEAPQKLFSLYMSPGAVTEKVHFFLAIVDDAAKIGLGGGLEHEHEDLELVELPLDDAFAMIETGEIVDAKTVIFLQWALANRDRLKRA